MSNKSHRGVGVILFDFAMARAIFQQKDEAYKPFPLGYSFFGGAIEPGETEEEAAIREVGEEISVEIAKAIGPMAVTFSGYIPTKKGSFHFTLMEARIPDSLFQKILTTPVHEGKAAVSFDRAAFATLKMIWGLEVVLAKYL